MKFNRFFILVLLFCFAVACNTSPTPSESSAKKDACCKKDSAEAAVSLTSEITCPKCGHKKTESMPEDVCVLKYTCDSCKTDLFPKDGDCCVFCSYGSVKCPSKQE